ncbi:MAG TPA: carbohydrate ABC transporter permease [Microbacteriaceae bacterium]|nr:carbohydrate ABC transporter permease [Microbacteriaceae bacterium]
MSEYTVTARRTAKSRARSYGGRRPAWKTVILSAVMYVIAFVFVFPYIEMVLTSFRTDKTLLAPTVLPTAWSFSAYTTFFQTTLFGSLGISLIIAFGATAVVFLVATPAAYYAARYKFKGRIAFLILVLVTQMVQPASMLIGIYVQYKTLGGLNAVWALILVNAGFNMAFAVWILTAYFGSIPKELEEAAQVQGCSRIGAIWRVTLPLAGPGVITALIFTFIAAWNEFLTALTLISSPGKQPLPVTINSFMGAYGTDWQHLFSASVIATIPVIVLFALIEGKVVGGLTAGSIK